MVNVLHYILAPTFFEHNLNLNIHRNESAKE
jgi:hypothetical protein